MLKMQYVNISDPVQEFIILYEKAEVQSNSSAAALSRSGYNLIKVVKCEFSLFGRTELSSFFFAKFVWFSAKTIIYFIYKSIKNM